MVVVGMAVVAERTVVVECVVALHVTAVVIAVGVVTRTVDTAAVATDGRGAGLVAGTILGIARPTVMVTPAASRVIINSLPAAPLARRTNSLKLMTLLWKPRVHNLPAISSRAPATVITVVTTAGRGRLDAGVGADAMAVVTTVTTMDIAGVVVATTVTADDRVVT